MELVEPPAAIPKRPEPTPKAIINQKYGDKASYKTEQVQQSTQDGCPGLSILQQSPCLFRCCLQLPELSVTSEPCKKKRDAEQSAARMAIEKLGIHPSTRSNPSGQEAWNELVARLSFMFSNEFLLTLHPLTGHFRAALERTDDCSGLIPVAVFLANDSKLTNLCKYINHKAESNILLSVSFITRAARLSSSIATSEDNLWFRKLDVYSLETMQTFIDQKTGSTDDIFLEAIRIPCSNDKPVEPLVLNISSKRYYMDVIAQELGVTDTSLVMVSRSVGKASSETRVYFSAPQFPFWLDSSVSSNADRTFEPETLNARACYFSGQDIYGDAILATIGFKWKSSEISHENLSLARYYRMLVGRTPDGFYKLSREALLAAELPVAFTTRSNWRGSPPRELLCTFCRQNWLAEPEFSISCINDSTQSPPETSGTPKKMKLSKSDKETEHANEGGTGDSNGKGSGGPEGSFKCELKIFSKTRDLMIQCLPQNLYRRQNEAVQNAALKLLSWLNIYFKKLDMPIEKFLSFEDIHAYPHIILKELALCISVHTIKQTSVFQRCSSLVPDCGDRLRNEQQHVVHSLNIEGQDSGPCPSNGSLACISYSVSLVKEGEHMKEPLECLDEFEFEIGTSAVMPSLESCVTQMSVHQSACFVTDLPPQHLILAAAGELTNSLSKITLQGYRLEYSINLLRITLPLEDRMEQALFSPPLSKQRVEYAWRHINESGATTLVDFGCGSGSLLDSLMDHPTTALEKIVGVDISKKSLARAAKVLHLKLCASSPSSTNIKSALLYDGSITAFDSRLYGFDIGTCLEVIEHMEEEQACVFGDVVLSSFCPRILIVSTPNYEYNSIIQQATVSGQEEDGDDKTQSLPCKFRNHDHKFEWTREQFNRWASDLAARHNYSVEFSGVGGPADSEPGFASQIAVFRNGQGFQTDGLYQGSEHGDAHIYEVIWEWSSSNRSRSSL